MLRFTKTLSRPSFLYPNRRCLSLLHGPSEPKLLNLTLDGLLARQASKYGPREAVVCTSTKDRLTYDELNQRVTTTAKGLISLGIKPGDRIGIFAGNSSRYVEVLFAASRVGAISVLLNNVYSSSEIQRALVDTGCKLLFTASTIGRRDTSILLQELQYRKSVDLPELQAAVLLKDDLKFDLPGFFLRYKDVLAAGSSTRASVLDEIARRSSVQDVCNLQYTSGTTSFPKAAMLTHNNLVNNGHFVGSRMALTELDILCCPPPLFHCFGFVLGLLAVVTHGSKIVFPGESFSPKAVLSAVTEEQCTALHGVPAMFAAELDELGTMDFSSSRLRTGIAAGSPVPKPLMEKLQKELNLHELTITYGMTETSPASFVTLTDDPLEKRLSTVGRILPHTSAKIIDNAGNIVPLGDRGELCVAGYALQKGYWNDPKKTAEAMKVDENGVRWMHTGDEAIFDEEGYCTITGRIKDIIIRGGENISPLEVESRLVQHPAISQAAVVGLKDSKYGEIPVVFLKQSAKYEASHIDSPTRPADDELKEWVLSSLAKFKVPEYIFWIGDKEVGDVLPQTGSGKIRKNILREWANALVFGENN